jgi:ABC-2 type transport system permease protein
MIAAFFTAYKEFLILIRDRGGLAVIIIMPVALVFIIALVQDSAWRAGDVSGVKVLLVDQDNGPAGRALTEALSQAGFMDLSVAADGTQSTKKAAMKALQQGDYAFAVIVPKNTSTQFEKNARSYLPRMIGHLDDGKTMGDPNSEPGAPLAIHVAKEVKPPVRDVFLAAMNLVTGALDAHMALISVMTYLNASRAARDTTPMNMMLGRVPAVELVSDNAPSFPPVFHLDVIRPPEKNKVVIPTATQHNVPAWTIFGMFFILIPMSGSIIRERRDGTLMRILTTPVSLTAVNIGRIGFYTAACLIQAVMMLGIGVYLLPLVGLDPLVIDHGRTAIVLMSLSTGFAAACAGYLTGVVFRAPEKAAMFGSISIVILAALGGIMVPAALMPAPLELLGRISPLGWGLRGYNEIFVHGGGLVQAAPYMALLAGFSMISLVLSVYLEKRGRVCR